ncbi:hypothetical protein [Cognataquiflexum aquatile]|uniref:hypothetical protein n=1 Tax=Cognataquiflexum aquatile TaxID=2249427 RepID=UPI0013008010|nr:hypothetical protein [Cognataquiflexum aquatile]
MGLKNFKIWGVFLVAIVVIAFMLFQQSRRNRLELENQSIRNMALVKGNFEVAYQSLTNQILLNERKGILEQNLKDMEAGRNVKKKYTKFSDFDFVKIESTKLNLKNIKEPYFEVRVADSLMPISLEKLFGKINQQDFFETIFLTDTAGSILYPYSEIGKKFRFIKTQESEINELPISKDQAVYNDENYLVYSTPVVIGNLEFFLTAVIKSSYFESIGRRVDFTNLTILVFLLGLMFFSTPIISFFGLTKGDKLTRFGVFSIGLSLVGIMVMIGFGFSFFKNHHPISDSNHENALDWIRADLSQNINKKVEILKKWDVEWNNGKYNELISIDSIGAVKEIIINGKEDNSLPQHFRSLSHREYYHYFLAEPKENSTFNTKKIDTLYIGSHYSTASAILESVISSYQLNNDWVRAITFNWNGAKINYGDTRKFFLVKENGLVLHKSQRIKVVADSLSQLLSTEKWHEVKGIISKNRSAPLDFKWEIPLYLDGHAFLATLCRVQSNHEFDQTLWLLYLKDEHLEHVYSSLITFETTVFIFFYLFLLGIISISNKVNKSKSANQQLEKFAYNYIFPKQSKLENFKILISLSVACLFVILYYYHLTYVSFFGMFLVLIINTFHYRILMFILLGPLWINSPKASEKNQNDVGSVFFRNKQLFVFFLSIGFILLLAFLKLYSFVSLWHFALLLVWVVTSSIISFIKRQELELRQIEKARLGQSDGASYKIWSSKFQKKLTIDFHFLFTNFFIMWIFMVGFVPGYVLYSKVQWYESNFWEAKLDKEQFSEPDEFWQTYDEMRRQIFGSLTSQTDPLVTEFIYQDRSHISPKLSNKVYDFKFWEDYNERIPNNPWWIGSVTLLFLMIVGGLVWLVVSLIYKIYLLEFTFFQDEDPKVDPKLKESKQSLFLVGIDSDLIDKWMENNFPDSFGSILKTDCSSNPDLTWGKRHSPNLTDKKYWLIKNIHFLPDQGLLVQKLSSIINFANENEVRLILSSGVSWKELYMAFKQSHDQINYSQLFSSFHFQYIPIKLPDDLVAYSFGEEETSILIRSRKAFFYNIWTELSFDEKKVCYYFSQEGFFNYSNKSTILELMQKGVLVRRKDELPKFFDRNFKHFILSNVTDEEKSAFKTDEKKHGNVSSIQVAVFSFILLSVAMISYFDKNFLDQATTFVTGIVGALGSIYSLFSKGLSGLRGKSES